MNLRAPFTNASLRSNFDRRAVSAAWLPAQGVENDGGNHRNGNGTAIARWRRDIVSFITEVLINPETGQPFELYPKQVAFLRHAFELTPEGRMRYTELCFSAGKKSGKKRALAAMIVIFTAVCLAGTDGEIYLLANDLEQSQSRVFKVVVLANDYQGFSGANPTLNVYDESAYYTSENSRRLWDDVPSPARQISFRLSVSTAGFYVALSKAHVAVSASAKTGRSASAFPGHTNSPDPAGKRV